jgi:hypothetical protein
MRVDDGRVLVVDVAGGGDCPRHVVGVRQLRRGRKHLNVDTGPVHQP